MKEKVDNPEEMFDVVDENDEVIGKMRRGEAHTGKKKIHRKIHVLVFNSKGEIFVQRRSMKRKQRPGYWQSSAAGHVKSGDTYEQATEKECREELGVEINPIFVTKYMLETFDEREFVAVMEARQEGPFRVDRKEADEAKFIPMEELLEKEKSGEMKLTEHFERSLNEYLKAKGRK